MLVPIAGVFGLTSLSRTETPILPPTILSVPASNYTYLSTYLNGNNEVTGAVEVTGGREIAFYVMDAGNFSQWRNGRPSTIILVRPEAVSYNFTFTSITDGTYYFVFDNQDTTRHDVVFSLSAVKTATILNPIVELAGYETLALGIVLFLMGVRRRRRNIKPTRERIPGWKCKFCGAENVSKLTFCGSCGRSQQ